MDKLLERSKDFEYLRDKYDPAYNDLVKAIAIVKKFIIDHNLILYGGSALDFALRLKGDEIYPSESLAVPDLDFYSPTNVEHSYQLADILFNAGFKSVRVVRAIYVRTMKVDLVDSHWIADITFCPKEVFDTLPTLKYNDMRIIHPDFQRIDTHSALSHPYDNPPNEVIFDRWSKDIKRFNLLNKHYPLIPGPDQVQLRMLSIVSIGGKSARVLKHCTMNGWMAFAIIARHFHDLVATLKLPKPPTFIKTPTLSCDETEFGFHTFDRTIDIVHFDEDKCAAELALTNIKKYEPYMSAIPETLIGEMYADSGPIRVNIFSSKNRLVSVNVVKITSDAASDDKTIQFKVVNVQYLLRHFAAQAHMARCRKNDKLCAAYLAHYNALLEMIRYTEEKVLDKSFGVLSDEIIAILKQSPLWPSTYTYGADNKSLAYLVSMNNILHDFGEQEQFQLPWNYYPERSLAKGIPHPQFNPEDSEFYREAGREIIENKDTPKLENH